MSIGADPSMNDIKDWELVILKRKKLLDLLNVMSRSFVGQQFAMDAMHVVLRYAGGREKRFVGQFKIALVVTGRNTAFIYPEEVHVRPIKAGLRQG
jgi:hypothetical protein